MKLEVEVKAPTVTLFPGTWIAVLGAGGCPVAIFWHASHATEWAAENGVAYKLISVKVPE